MEYESTLAKLRPGAPLKVDLLVLPGSSLMTYASAAEPMRAANRLAGRALFHWRFLSQDGQPPLASAGIPLPVAARFDPAEPRDILGVIAGFGAPASRDRALIRTIYRAAKAAPLTMGIESGAWLLARAGLLDGRRATTHWEDFEEFATAFPLVDLRPDRFVADGAILTTSGAMPTFDLMVDLLRQRGGQGLALDAAGVFNYDITHRATDRQSPVAFGLSGRFDRRLVRAVEIMQDSLDSPLPIAAIARSVRLTARGLELLFQRQIGQSPGHYYQSLRMVAARKMLLDTDLQILDIAARSGFSSLAAFSRAYRRSHGIAPSAERRAARTA